MKKIDKCLWCGSSKLSPFAHRKDGVGVLKCEKCGLYMVDAVPEDLESYYYDETYYNASETNIDTGYAEMYDLMAPAFLYWQNSLIEELNEAHKPKDFLEIGCATGNLLEIIKDNQPNLDIEGIDISEYAVMAAKAKGLKASVEYINTYKSSKRKKDIIFSSETMEHLDDLKSFLDGVSKNISDDGVFMFYVPSISVGDAEKDVDSYLRFNTNLEHLLHFTPEFFKNQFSKFFNAEVVLKEFKTGFGPCIIGAVSRDSTSLSDLKKLFKSLDDEIIPKNASDIFLKNLTIISLKFANFKLAAEARNMLGASKTVKESELLLLDGLAGYHDGNLNKSNAAFEAYLKHFPGNNFAIRSILSNERELNRELKKNIAKLNDEASVVSERLLASEDKIREFNQSKIIGLAIKARPIVSKPWFFAKKVIRKSKSIAKSILNRVIPSRLRPVLSYVFKLKWLVRLHIIDNVKYPKNLPLVTVVIPYFNAGKTIDETIDSLRAQTFVNLEVILVNDGSTDSFSIEKLKTINYGTLNFKIINQKNMGVASARNKGIGNAKGKYVVCLDSDDILDSTYIEKCATVLETNPTFGLVSTDMRIFGVRNLMYKQGEYNPYQLLHNNMVITASMFPRIAWEQSGGYKSNIGYEDWEYWINLAENGYWGKRIAEPIFNYRTAISSRYIDDQSKHKLNVSKIKSLHHGYDRRIDKIKRQKYFNICTISHESAFINLNNQDLYNYTGDDKKINILITMPWMTFGGAETLVYNYCREIKETFNISFMTGLKSEHEWEYKFKEITNRIYHLANLFDDRDLYLEFISNYISTRNIDVLHIVHNGFMFDLLPELKIRHPKLKVVVTMFNDRVEYFSESVKYAKYIDNFISDNHKVTGHYNNLLGSNKTLRAIPNGVDCETEFSPELFDRKHQRAKLALKENDLAVFFIGRLSQEKNPNIFIDVARKIIKDNSQNSVKFFVIGDGVLRPVIEKQIIAVGGDRIKYLGYQTDIASYLSAADIFILPSSIEGFPLSILEAMSMGVATIASDVGAVSDILEDGVDGFVVAPGSADDISGLIVNLNNDDKLLDKVKSASRKKIEKKYSNKILKTNYIDMYKDVMK